MSAASEGLLPVTQADRDLWSLIGHFTPNHSYKVYGGSLDNTYEMQAIAAHRIAHQPTGEVELMAAAQRIHAAHMKGRPAADAWPWEEANKSFYRDLAIAALASPFPLSTSPAPEVVSSPNNNLAPHRDGEGGGVPIKDAEV